MDLPTSPPLLPSLLLAVSITSVWWPAVRLAGRTWPAWPWLVATTLGAAAAQGLVDLRGVGAVGLAMAAGWGSRALPHAALRTCCTLATVGLAFGLGLRLLPGFVPVVWIPDTLLSPDSTPFRFTAHVDAGLAALLLLAFCAPRCHTGPQWRTTLQSAWPVAAGTTVAVIGFAWALGHVQPDLKWPVFAAAFLAKMLLWTCVMEEAFFRGVLQERLARWPALGRAPWLVIGGPAVLFGLAHAAGGWAYVGLATLAGVGYGLAYARTRRVEAAIAVHFVVNAVHFVAFSYPRLAPV